MSPSFNVKIEGTPLALKNSIAEESPLPNRDSVHNLALILNKISMIGWSLEGEGLPKLIR